MEYPKIPNIYKREEGGKNKLIEGEYTSPELDLLAHVPWVWTEKVDGTNIRVIWDGYGVSFAGRTDKANIPAHLQEKLNELFGGPDKEELFEQKFGNTPVILFGEGYGEKIQNGGSYGPANFILFDVLIDGWWLQREAVEGIAAGFGIEAVPILGAGPLTTAVEYVRVHPQSRLRNGEIEGVVCKPAVELRNRRGERLIVKIKCRDFS